MIDRYGRKIDYLRISVTDRCNFRCRYCMPEDGIELRKHKEVLTFDEITRIVRIMSTIGIRKIKLTGGEPLVRKGVPSLVENLRNIEGIEDITITTNGYILEQQIDDLVNRGLTGVNISLDTLDKTLFANITRVDGIENVLRAIEKVKEYKNLNIKVNCVPLGLEEQDLKSIALLAKDNNIHVRFIEMMPIGLGKQYDFVSEEEIIKRLTPEIGEFKPFISKLGNGPSHYYDIDGFKGKIGFISSLTHKFCHECNRIRLTSTGYLKTCLQYDVGADLRALLRDGSSDEVILKAIENAILHKPMEHAFLKKVIINEESNGMSRIGG